MHKNIYWWGFVILFASVTLAYAVSTTVRLYHYYGLTDVTEGKVNEWTAERIGDDKYALKAHYSYTLNGKAYHGTDLEKWPIYRNAASAEKAANVKPALHEVWYRAKKPSASSLEKKFPTREVVYTAALLLTFIYLLSLGVYIARRNA